MLLSNQKPTLFKSQLSHCKINRINEIIFIPIYQPDWTL